ncbi:MAG: hypothetical protein LIP23_09605, partial [Planctomycetes bacterium]|nr:hypothetical protein [Planctomycetota bacterium]
EEGDAFLGSGGLEIIAGSFQPGEKVNIDIRFRAPDGEYVGFQDFLSVDDIIYGSGPVDDSLSLVADTDWEQIRFKIFFKNVHIGYLTNDDNPTTDLTKYHYIKLQNIECDDGRLHIGGVGLDEIAAQFCFNAGTADKYDSLTLSASLLKTPPGVSGGWMPVGTGTVTLVPSTSGGNTEEPSPPIEPPTEPPTEPRPPEVEPTDPPGGVEPSQPPESLPGDDNSGDGGDGEQNNADTDPSGEDPLEGEDGTDWDDLFEEAERGDGDGDNGSDDNGGDTSDPDGEPADESPVLGSDMVSDIYGDVVGMGPGDSYSDVINAALQRDFGTWFKNFSGDDQTSPDEIFAQLEEMLSNLEWADGIFTQDEALALGMVFSEMRSSLDIITQHINAVFTLLDDMDSNALPPNWLNGYGTAWPRPDPWSVTQPPASPRSITP